MSYFLVREPGQTRVHASHIKGSSVWLCDTPIESGEVLAVDDEHLTCPTCWAALEQQYLEQLCSDDAHALVFHFRTHDGELQHLSQVKLSRADDGRIFVKGQVESEWGKRYGIHYHIERVLSFFIDGRCWTSKNKQAEL